MHNTWCHVLCAVEHEDTIKASHQGELPKKTHTLNVESARAGSLLHPESEAVQEREGLQRFLWADVVLSNKQGQGSLPRPSLERGASTGQPVSSKHTPRSVGSGWTGPCCKPEGFSSENVLSIRLSRQRSIQKAKN